jgi:hypothetical protein
MLRSRVALVLTAIAVALAPAGCGDDPSPRDEMVSRIKTDPQMAGADDRTVGCIADWYEDYATEEQRTALRDGGRVDAAGSAPAGSPAETAMVECLKLATDIKTQ